MPQNSFEVSVGVKQQAITWTNVNPHPLDYNELILYENVAVQLHSLYIYLTKYCVCRLK